MKRMLIGIVVGLFLGWGTVPLLRAAYDVSKSDSSLSHPFNDDEDDTRGYHEYKWYLRQLLLEIKLCNDHLTSIDANIKLVKDKLHA